MAEQTQCLVCLMDRSAKEIIFDDLGVCNFCKQARKSLDEVQKEKKNLNKGVLMVLKFWIFNP